MTDARRPELLARKPLTRAPDICVEVLSTTDSKEELEQKTQAYLAAGAREVIWFDADAREVRFFHAAGQSEGSAFGLRLESLFAS